ncbi:hypothetical protein P168DRAFT_318547 [Aspergillus campestris IBT 28561]|uniref:TeaA receptor TeaR n=1 Tax=Aspergillus campestris (strain IBT 28561) TaxID=1392248 RepID=A0A2I1D2U8_ASPC2|nr:uncharacterized protein P168DRAFT_318547 [Aspergillus campestris IBT 28561]PKY04202.1 hypothetical protein P168DRAFT_318547 [Aspergillus campestris IBT 28561]
MAGTTTTTVTDTWSPPVNENQWDYAVPVRRNSARRRSKSRSSQSRDRDRTSKGSRSSSLSRAAYHEQYRGRRDASRTRHGSEAGLYAHDAPNRSRSNVRDSDTSQISGSWRRSEMKDGPDTEHENWIHRDKLARIESMELHQAAVMFQRRAHESGRSTRARNRNSGISEYSVAGPPPDPAESFPDLQEERASALGMYDDSTRDGDWDLRRQEEVTESAAHMYRHPGQHKSASRIPIPAGESSPPDDGSPLGSASRPGSRGVPSGSSATSRKTSGKTTPGTTARKTSAPAGTRKTTPRSRAVSGARPTTRSGESRPTTAANRPEGDPPWLATMYKPDPRLPPDQQMLPTHARRLQQEQWAKEGKTPTTYDREFAPLAIGPDGPPDKPGAEKPEMSEDKPEEKPKEKPETEKDSNPKEHPPPPTPSITSPDPQRSPDLGRLSTATGYSHMPKVHEVPHSGMTSRWSPPVVSAPEPEKKRGCCCIVM